MKAVLIRKTVQPKNIVGVDRFNGAGMKVGVKPCCLHDSRAGKPRDGSVRGWLRGRRERAL